MESKLAQTLLHYPINYYAPAPVLGTIREGGISKEEWTTRREEQIKEQKAWAARQQACAIVAIAEELVTTHNLEVPSAFEIAKSLWVEAKLFVDNFKLPEDTNQK